ARRPRRATLVPYTPLFRSSLAPARARAAVGAQAERIAVQILTKLDYVGVVGVELFELEDGRLLVNEIAPRVHNTGHWTQDGREVDQVEQHIRAVAGWPRGPTHPIAAVERLNLLGPDAPGLRRLGPAGGRAGAPHPPLRQARSQTRPQDGAREPDAAAARAKVAALAGPVLEPTSRERLGPVAALMRRAFPKARKYSEAYLDWLYFQNPAGPALAFDVREGDRIISHGAGVPQRLMLHGRPVLGALMLNTATDADRQGRGLFSRIVNAVIEETRRRG